MNCQWNLCVMSRLSRFTSIIIIVFCFAFFLSSFIFAAPCDPEETGNAVHVHSAYQSVLPGSRISLTEWNFSYKYQEDGTFQVMITDSNRKIQCRAIIFYDKNRRLVKADCFRTISQKEECDTAIFDPLMPAVLDQTLIPGDSLNCNITTLNCNQDRQCVIKRRVGDIVVFVDKLLLKKEMISIEEAVSQGMLNEKNLAFVSAEPLYVLSLFREESDGKVLVLRQIWQAGAKFWLYEEKNNRRSWLAG